MADIESILWEMFDEDRGQFGASGSPAYIAEVLTEKLTSGEAVERAARAMDENFNPDRHPIMDAMFRDYAKTALKAAIEGEQ